MEIKSGLKFHHSGELGDIIYSLNFVKHISKNAIYYINEIDSRGRKSNFYEMINRLLKSQDEIFDVFLRPNGDPINVDYNLDNMRRTYNMAHHHILQYPISFGVTIDYDWAEPWLKIKKTKNPNNKPFIIINRTERYHASLPINWKQIIIDLKNNYENEVYFIGMPHEFDNFTNEFGGLIYLPTKDLLEAAEYINGADKCYLGSSSCCAIAMGIGKQYYVEIPPHHHAVMMSKKPNEHVLNPV